MAYQITFWDITDGHIEINFDGSDLSYMPKNVARCLLKYEHIPTKSVHWQDDHGPFGKELTEEEVDMHIEQYKIDQANEIVNILMEM